jgi:hypothetical protein
MAKLRCATGWPALNRLRPGGDEQQVLRVAVVERVERPSHRVDPRVVPPQLTQCGPGIRQARIREQGPLAQRIGGPLCVPRREVRLGCTLR